MMIKKNLILYSYWYMHFILLILMSNPFMYAFVYFRSAEKQRSKAAIELNNGRAAQMGILALMVHEKLNNDPYIINTLLGSPVPFN